MGKKKRAAQKIAMISSTAQDLPDHRRAVMDACLCSGVFPKMMEQLPASDKDAITVSLEMVETSDIYIGVYGNRYGWIPKGYDKSITELEYDHAVSCNLPILIFLMHRDHPIVASQVEKSATAQKKLNAFKQPATDSRIRVEFKSVDELRGLVIQSLANL